MSQVDTFSQSLLEEAKRFLEKAKSESRQSGQTAYLHAALLLGFAALEAHLNSVADDFSHRKELPILEQSILFEKRFTLDNGKLSLTKGLKMYRLEDRIQFIYRRFSGKPINKQAKWWANLKQGIRLRNELIHAKQHPTISKKSVEQSLQAILDAIRAMYRAIYNRDYPFARRALTSQLDF